MLVKMKINRTTYIVSEKAKKVKQFIESFKRNFQVIQKTRNRDVKSYYKEVMVLLESGHYKLSWSRFHNISMACTEKDP